MAFVLRPKPFLLIILDGWGYSESEKENAIHSAAKPTWDTLWATYPHTTLYCSGLAVGLPEGQMGNSEVGHLTIGAGRVLTQDLTRIHKAIEDKTFFQNPTLLQTLEATRSQQKALHILGLLSPGGVHSHERHIHALIECAAQKGISQIYCHVFCDGRDLPPQSALASLNTIENLFKKLGKGQVASLTGRYYAMDRDNRWNRTQAAYDVIVRGHAPYTASSAIEALNMAYARGETDEFIKPTTIHSPSSPPYTLHSGDTVFFMNFRADRARQLTQALFEPNLSNIRFVTLTQYSKEWPIPCLFPPIPLVNILTDVFAEKHMKQLRLAETEKYAHVTFFFNGGKETPVEGEDRILIPSPKVSTYDQAPAMSAPLITDTLLQTIKNQTHDVIICNFANADMVGHTGNFSASVSAIETLDTCLSKIIPPLLNVGGEALITADHGNAEKMVDLNTRTKHTAHTLSPVPLLYIGKRSLRFRSDGKLSDLAPTLLELLSIEKPLEMTGQSLII
ncbi:MAG: 2,3-bisphosphoglycerate-independent phosphoglycerate mutase [Gammaproteobacteria bacterium]|nr:2,3-bisphosphoglycerate-independent phosphoglycerate mutase [Gammaproteobacteria bacterium]